MSPPATLGPVKRAAALWLRIVALSQDLKSWIYFPKEMMKDRDGQRCCKWLVHIREALLLVSENG